MIAQRTWLLAAIATLALVGPARATLEVHEQGGVPYVSGGAGGEERQAIDAMPKRFNLKLTMALANGDFVSDATVRISDAQGNQILEVVADGPILLVQLKPGTYTVTCTMNGKERKATAQVTGDKQTALGLTWTSE